MIRIEDFESRFSKLLPETEKILREAQLCVHRRVTQVVLHGSRGLAGGYRPDSDIDLSLLVHAAPLPAGPELDRLLRVVLETTLENWQGSVEPDLAAVFDIRECGLRCFCIDSPAGQVCKNGGVDCFGLHKIQKGYNGFVIPLGKELAKMYPRITIWQRAAEDSLPAA